MRATLTRGDLREGILDAVDRLLGRFGYAKMTMDDLAREAGIARRTIYLYFTSKEEVALSSIDRVVQRLTERLAGIAGSGGAPDLRLREMLRTRVLFRFDTVQDYYQSFDDLFAALRPAYLARRERYFAAEAALFAGVLEEGCRAGVFASGDANATAHTLLLATNALLPYSLRPRELDAREEIDAKVTRIADLLLDGLRRRKPHRGTESSRADDGSM
jgi:AcrR family transcriptional regulator